MKNQIQKLNFYLLILLFLFLPFSSWLVSLSGKPSLSLLRDIIVLLIFILILMGRKIHFNKITSILVIFIIYGLLSYLWREASPLQWLRGFRFTFIPLLLLFSVANIELNNKEKKTLLLVILLGGLFVSIVSIAEFFGISIPLRTSFSGSYGLESAQYLQGETRRLQSVLAGPNALGLYLVALSAFALGLFGKITSKTMWLISLFCLVLVFTFSRSSLIGLIAVFAFSGAVWLYQKIGSVRATLLSVIFFVLLLMSGFVLYKSENYNHFITHGTSSSLRYEQIQRVWDSRGEIGFLGRGSGTAGPSSQNRLDGGSNNWSENIYMEMFEELGLIGFILYLTLIILLMFDAWKCYKNTEGRTAFLAIFGFVFAGLFINNYTGQVGIFLLCLAQGLSLQRGEK